MAMLSLAGRPEAWLGGPEANIPKEKEEEEVPPVVAEEPKPVADEAGKGSATRANGRGGSRGGASQAGGRGGAARDPEPHTSASHRHSSAGGPNWELA